MINDTLQHRRWVIAAIISAFVLLYIIRLFSLQIIETKYKSGAESNALLKKTIFPPRGLIYDRKNTLLVYNKPAYDIAMIMREIRDLDTLAFCKALGISREFFIQRIEEIKDQKKNVGYSSYTPQIFMTQLSSEDVANIQQLIYKFNGFYIQNRTLREYAFPNGAHIFGSIGEVSWNDIDKDPYYKLGDFAGRDGIEYTYEKSLRGEKGVEILLRDSRGRIKGKYRDGELDQEPKAGTNITLTIDIQLQIIAEKLLNGKIGSAVAIEPKTGEILALVSNPGYDPAILVGRQRSKNYAGLVKDPTKPLMNRATQAQYSPGSTFKPLQALVCQQLGGINEHTRYGCNGPNSSPIKCTHNHGSPVSLLNAIEQSCNPYFWNAFKATIEKNGYGTKNLNFKNSYQEWVDAMHSFGLGKKFEDSDIYEQTRGNIPTQKYFNRYFGETGWRALTIRSLSIGQGEVLVTPLQLANTMAAIANEGYYITPHLNKNDSMLLKKHVTAIDKKYFPIVNEGMWRVFEFGTGRYYKVANLSMCGKTGTVQNNHGKDHSLFVGFAPRENPVIAIAVVVENAGFGATWAAPVASLMMEQYIYGKIERTELYDRISSSTTSSDVKKR
ncbi:MAG: penicillin-binding transpeptidase domain-containing protein [Paludibacter sp.]|nr:penicillin-binding transpeptidase domain-containing protein [Paludibacter sp.]